jgi:regulator of cell morphogenesis and NO signaling
MNQLPVKTLAQIVTDNHRTASVFEKYHLDFCCKGKRSLEQACIDEHVSIADLLKDLENASSSSCATFPYERLSATALTDYIVLTHHDYIKRETPAMAAYLEKMTSKHSERHPELRRIFELFMTIKNEMGEHMQKEEQILFPRIREMEKVTAQGYPTSQKDISYLKVPILMMEEEHDNAGNCMSEIRQLTNNYTVPQDACTTYKVSFACLQAFELDLHQHVHLENNILFPKALELFEQFNQCPVIDPKN